MKSFGYKTCFSLGVSTCAVGVLVAMFACSSSSAPPPPPQATPTQCTTKPGEFPAPNCLPFAANSGGCAAAGTCATAPCNANSPCLAMADNSGQNPVGLRMRKLLVTAPPALAFNPTDNMTFVQKSVIDNGINLDYQCGEPGTGTFNWLIEVDTVKKTLKTGCAPPSTDPFGVGYCFVNATIEGLQVGPVTDVPLTVNSDGSYSTANIIPTLNVPIFVAAGTANATSSVIVLPLSGASVRNVTLSADHNCIGSYNSNAVTPVAASGGVAAHCVDTDDTACARWTTAGSLGGYITVDDADAVDVPQLAESLCVLLASPPTTDQSNPNEKRCPKDSSGKVMVTGDFCSTTGKAGGCADSYWLSATFAASAAKISDTPLPNQPACAGQVIGGDGGVGDSGSPTDAGGQ